jgi:hypothetical protein
MPMGHTQHTAHSTQPTQNNSNRSCALIRAKQMLLYFPAMAMAMAMYGFYQLRPLKISPIGKSDFAICVVD